MKKTKPPSNESYALIELAANAAGFSMLNLMPPEKAVKAIKVMKNIKDGKQKRHKSHAHRIPA